MAVFRVAAHRAARNTHPNAARFGGVHCPFVSYTYRPV